MNSVRIISASIVLFNTDMEQLNHVIRSYAPSENKLLYLIDNSPKKINIDALQLKNKNIYYYFVGENKGYGAGHNIAIKMAIEVNAKYHVVLNPDLQFEPEIIYKIADFMDCDNVIAQVMPKILNPDGEIQYLCKLLPTPGDLIFKRFLPKRLSEKKSVRYQLKFSDYEREMNVPYLSGCFMFFRTSAFKAVGFFDENFFMYPEDIDITRRMHVYFKTIYYPKVSVVHVHASESYKNVKMFMIHVINIIRYFNKWGWFFDHERGKINQKVLGDIKSTQVN